MFYLSDDSLNLILLFLLIFLFSYTALLKVFGKKNIAFLVSLPLSLLAMFYLSTNQLTLVNRTYGLTGLTLLILLPTIIILFFMYNSNFPRIFRIMLWIGIGILSLVFLQNNQYSQDTTLVTMIVVGIIVFLIIFDKSIKNKFSQWKNTSRL